MTPMLGLGKSLIKNGVSFLTPPQLWTPASITTALWLDANDASTITLNGSTVSQWSDKSGNNRHYSQVTTAEQPNYTASGLNGKPTLTFDGVDDSLSVAAGAFQNINLHNVFIVFKINNPTTSGGLQQFFNFNYTFTQGFTTELFAAFFRNSDGTIWNHSRDTNNVFVGSSATPIPTVASILGGELRSNNTITTSLNGTLSTPAANANRSTQTFQNSFIGRRAAGNFLNGIIGEIVDVAADLSAAGRQRLEGYLAWKWGLVANLPSSHPYKNSPPIV